MLKLLNVSKTYRVKDIQTAALSGVNLTIDQGDYLAVVGPSGCGKSTLLSILGLLDRPDSGQFLFDGQDVSRASEAERTLLRRGRVGFVFQSFNLIEQLTVRQNVEMALKYTDVSSAERRERADAMLDQLGVAHRAGHSPSQLSGGQQQRVAIARALVARPQVLLADEPTGNLDSSHGEEVMRLLRDINRNGTTLVMVTHSPAHARQASRVIEMKDGRNVQRELQAA
ncbi:ABC transporter ATP-binding protein [Roseateles amylovorans]|uniref:ABC transporter ATP-binding protein n=1 Tax=Roseateles amylovorans TaxID=2978473 RepID=A0ABY6AXU2_9BURK|nr:ABC transporter ATP-binding protein [Roseateles amylovorans]UXH76113.1 ABC transporter ATP-binding protein [Roseateles amylovorans]